MSDTKTKEPPKPTVIKSWMCKCGAQFNDYDSYSKHKEGHRNGEVIVERDPVTDEPIIDPFPIVEAPPAAPQPPTPSVVKPSKIKLSYRYEGNCPDCGKEAETIELEDVNNDNKHVFAVAWCSVCKKKLQQNYVNKL